MSGYTVAAVTLSAIGIMANVLLITGPAQTWWPSGMIFFFIMCLATMATLVAVGNNFLYRYISLCRGNLSYIYSSRKHLIAGAAINLLPVLNWIAMIYFAVWPSDEFQKVAEKVWDDDVVVDQKLYIGITSFDGIAPEKLTIVIESFVMLLIIGQVSPFCAMQIHRCLKSSSMSKRTKEMYKKLLLLLSIQITCPTILMNAPLSIAFILFFSGLESPLFISYFVGIAMATYPLAGPVITIVFVKDYRALLLAALRLGKISETPCVPTTRVVKTTSTTK
ncbi:7TM chemoreceptor [Cooperia oncophora]